MGCKRATSVDVALLHPIFACNTLFSLKTNSYQSSVTHRYSLVSHGIIVVMKVKSIIALVDKIIEKINVEKINVATSFFLVAFLWAPHGAKECIRVTEFCSPEGPNFVAPMLFTFLAPNWVMDMSLRGWSMQILFAPPLLALMYVIVRLAKAKYGKLLKIYAIRWSLMYLGVIAYFNYVFWYGPLREYVFPLFTFTSSVFK
jgi:hypothetical protein